MATNIAAKAVALLSTPLFTRLLSPAEYGLYSLYISWLGIVSVVLSLGISGGAVYRGLGRYENREKDFISSAVGILLVSFFAIGALLLALSFFGINHTGFPLIINIMLIGEVFLNVSETVIFAFFRYEYKYVKICLINLLYAVLTPGVAVLLIYVFGIRSEARIYASFFVSLGLILPLILKEIRAKKLFDKGIWAYLAKLSLPLLPNSVATTLVAQCDKLMIERYSGAAALGKYSIAYSTGFMLTTLTGAIYSALQPWIMRSLNSGNSENAKKLTERIIFLTSLGLVLFLLLIPEIFSLIAAPEYRSAELAVYPLAIAGFFQFVSNLLAANIIHTEKTASLSIASMIAFVFNLFSNIMLLSKYGYIAAAFTTALSYAAMIGIEYFFLRSSRRESIIEAKSFAPLALVIFALPIYSLREIPLARILFAAATLLFAAPSAIKFIKLFIRRKEAL